MKFQRLGVPLRFRRSEQPRDDGGVVVDDGVRNQAGALVVDLDVRPAGEFFLASDLSDGGAELVVEFDPVLRAMDVASRR